MLPRHGKVAAWLFILTAVYGIGNAVVQIAIGTVRLPGSSQAGTASPGVAGGMAGALCFAIVWHPLIFATGLRILQRSHRWRIVGLVIAYISFVPSIPSALFLWFGASYLSNLVNQSAPGYAVTPATYQFQAIVTVVFGFVGLYQIVSLHSRGVRDATDRYHHLYAKPGVAPPHGQRL